MFTTKTKKNGLRTLAFAGAVGLFAGGQATAAGMVSDAPPPMGPAWQLELSANVALASEYVFRGISQTDENPAIQGGFDASYGLFYAGVWASNLDFGGANPSGDLMTFEDVANIEIDWYGGIKKELWGAEWDFGVIYYSYPNAFDGNANAPGGELDYWELKGGVSTKLWHDITASFTTYYAWEYTGEIGENWVFEGGLEVPLPEVLGLSPSLSGTLAYNDGDVGAGGVNYWYWNAGLGLGFYERFNLDLRYWDTDNLSGCSTATIFQCDDRYVATVSATF